MLLLRAKGSRGKGGWGKRGKAGGRGEGGGEGVGGEGGGPQNVIPYQ